MPPDFDHTLESQIRECYGRVVYTHKAHECMADRLHRDSHRFKIAQILLAGITSGGALSVLFTDGWWLEAATVFIATLSLIVAAYLKNIDPGAWSQQHKEHAAKLWNVRECYLSLLTDLPVISHEMALERRDELQTNLAALYTSAPRTDRKAYSHAQDRLKNMEDMTLTDHEIDVFLPFSLKRTGERMSKD